MSTSATDLRFRNPFREATSSETIENPEVYAQIFSQTILVNETLDVFEKSNVVLTGPQGTGKTMILCLFRHSFLAACLQRNDTAGILTHIRPYLSISINLVRSGFHVFGRRSPAQGGANDTVSPEDLNAQGASDVLCHTLFRQLLLYLQFLISEEGEGIRQWMQIPDDALAPSTLARELSKWTCWRHYYSRQRSLEGLLRKCEERLDLWHDFLNANLDNVPDAIWRTTPPLEDVLHRMGKFAANLTTADRSLPLYVVIDQYEVLPELNRAYGTRLQRIVNSLIKSRDPYVYYKIGARPYDWGKELRVWGAESRIEVDRDYKIVSLIDILRKGENKRGWLFPKFAMDVAFRRLQGVFADDLSCEHDYIKKMFGSWSENQEAEMYLGKNPERRRREVVRRVPDQLRAAIETRCGDACSVLDLRLACAWTLQRIQRNEDEKTIVDAMSDAVAPWERSSWRKERVEVALLQIASMTNQRKYYFGWKTVLYLSGADIRAFLRICEEVWELAAKIDAKRLVQNQVVSRDIQTEGIFEASHHWRMRDRTETYGGGSHRYSVLSSLGPAIHEYLVKDLAISNPGHSGFSVRETDLTSEEARKVVEFLGKGVNWAIFEERPHTSKNREGASRSKWFLHPILSPAFGIPLKRVKEPFYTTVDELHRWFVESQPIRFGSRKKRRHKAEESSAQRTLPFGDDE